MAKKKAAKAAVEPVLVPGRMRECSALIRQLGEKRRELQRMEAAMNDELAEVKSRYEKKAAFVTDTASQLEKRIEAYCIKWRGPLTAGGRRKSYDFPDGTVSWRKLPAKVNLRSVEKIVEFCQRQRGFAKFLRVKTEPDKEAMLKDAQHAVRIPGVTIGSDGENFDIAPFEAKLEEVA